MSNQLTVSRIVFALAGLGSSIFLPFWFSLAILVAIVLLWCGWEALFIALCVDMLWTPYTALPIFTLGTLMALWLFMPFREKFFLR